MILTPRILLKILMTTCLPGTVERAYMLTSPCSYMARFFMLTSVHVYMQTCLQVNHKAYALRRFYVAAAV